MRYDISGTVMQTVSIDLERGEQVYSQTAAMAWMTQAIVMDTHTGGGLFAGLKRAMSGGTLFITDFTAEARRARSPSRRASRARSCRWRWPPASR